MPRWGSFAFGPRTVAARSSRTARWIGAGLSLIVVTGCMGLSGPSASPPPDGNAAGTTSPGPTSSIRATPGPPTGSAAPTGSATPVAEPVPIAGEWRVRKVLSLDDRSALIPGDAAFDDEAFVVTPGCDTEPCPTVEVSMTPLGRTEPVSVVVLSRAGDRYVSAAQAENEGPCLDDFGGRVHGGATVSSTMRLWAATTRPAGSAVESTQLMGSLELRLAPTSIGTAAGCEEQTASYELTGRREAVAVVNEPSPDPEEPPNTAGGLANLPAISAPVDGAKVLYFGVRGDTVGELFASMARGGLKACGEINYEWHEGDDRPAACAITAFPDTEDAIRERTASNGTCTITRASVKARFTIHIPRWTAPKRVPVRLLDWWRDVVDFIRDHEAGHVRISRDFVKKLNARLDGADCGAATSTIRKWSRQLTAAHEEYDRVEYQKPWPVPPAGY